MKVSLNLVKKFTKIKLPTAELVDLIGSKIGAVESVTDLGERYEGAMIVKIVEVERHSNADKLNVCKVDDGNVTDNVERDERGLIQVVCGAPNVEKNMLAVWLKPGSTVPSSYKDKHPIVLEPKDLRGFVSQGMLASSKELDINNDHNGILQIDKKAVVGQKFADLYELDDIIIDIENKMLTHRPDCFGILGIAREIAGITETEFKSPDWYLNNPDQKIDFHKNNLIEIDNTIPELVPEFLAQVIEGIEIKPSNFQTQSYLNRLGIRPINNIVDQTNYIMIITGQPLHAYDYDKLKALQSNSPVPKIVIRKPKPNEQLELLNGKTVMPSRDTILISTDNHAIGLGGVMGGSTTEVDLNTKNIVVECATFDMYSIRRTSMENGIFSEAVTRFNKGQSRLQNIHILPQITKSIIEVAGGNSDSAVVSDNKQKTTNQLFDVEVDFVNNLLGIDLEAKKMAKLLTNVEIVVSETDNKLTIEPPFWRTDLEIKQDIAEEVGRLYGYDKLILNLPERSAKPVAKNKLLDFKQTLRDLLLRVGANETLTYSFVHGNLIYSVDQDNSRAYKLSNAISPDIQYYRLSLTPSLIEKIHLNVKDGYSKFVLFEMAKIIDKGFRDPHENTLPEELNRLSIALTDDDGKESAFYQARAYLDYLMIELGLKVRILPIDDKHLDKKFLQASKVFEPVRSGLIYVGNNFLGIIGEPKSSVKKLFKLPNYTSIIEIDLDKFVQIVGSRDYVPLSRYPKIDQDVCFRVPEEVKYVDLFNMIKLEINKFFKNTYIQLVPLDIFKPENNNFKQITFRISLNSYTKTLKSSDLKDLVDGLKTKVSTDFEGEII
jgi:phenylalanyl-tRNA synthetase beta chain